MLVGAARGDKPTMDAAKVSMVTTVYNDVRVARALDSIFAQRYAGEIESVVVDADSTDGTKNVLARYAPRLAVCISEPDDGLYHGMNKGIALATGDIVGILNSDDRLADADVLATVAAAFERHPDVDICYGDIVYRRDDDSFGRYWRSGRSSRLKWRLGWRPPHPAFFVRRSVYERYGAFVPDLPIAADYELQLRLLMLHGLRYTYIDRVLAHMAPGGIAQRSLRNILQANLECASAWRRHRLRGGLLVPVLKPARSLWQSLQREPSAGEREGPAPRM